MTDYTALTGPQLLEALGDDASKWAEAMQQHNEISAVRKGRADEVAFMLTWFANAIEHSSEVRKQREAEEAARGWAAIESGCIVIRIPVDTLQRAADTQNDGMASSINIKITNTHRFSESVVMALSSQYEDGTTLIQRAIGAACIEAFEQGANGAEEVPVNAPDEDENMETPE
jgi:hypothetical protein